MELYVMFVFVAFLQLSSAFLMQDILTNGTTPSVVSSSSESVEQRLHDLTTWLLEEKHIRYTLEQRLTQTENKVDIFDKFHELVTTELQTERDKINRLERNLANANTTNDALDALEKDLKNATAKIVDLQNDLNIANAKINALEKDNQSERDKVSRLEQNLANATSEIGTLVNRISKLEYRFNDSSLEIDNLHNGIQQLNQTQLHSESNTTLWNKDNIVAFSVDYPDDNHNNPQLFNDQLLELGGGYNRGTGKFVCHTPGIYVFMWSITQQTSGLSRRCCLRINGSQYGNACATTSGGTGGYNSGSRTTIIHLNKNDLVYLICTSGSSLSYSGFSGFLLYPEG